MDPVIGAVLSIGFSGTGCIISIIAMWTAQSREISQIDDLEKLGTSLKEQRQRTFVSMEMPITVVVFSLVLWFIVTADELFVAACLNMGVSGFIVAIAEGYHVRSYTKAVIENPELCGKSIIGPFWLKWRFYGLSSLPSSQTGMLLPGFTEDRRTPLVSINASACGINGVMVTLGSSSFLVGPRKYPWSTASMTV